MKYYYKVYTSTPYVGTDDITLIKTNNPEYEIDVDILKEELLNNYGYLAVNWDEDMTEEQEEEFKDSCEVSLTAISEETFYAMIKEGYDWEED